MQKVYIQNEESNKRNCLDYKPIGCSFRDITVISTWNIHYNLPKSLRRCDNFQYVGLESILPFSHIVPFCTFIAILCNQLRNC